MLAAVLLRTQTLGPRHASMSFANHAQMALLAQVKMSCQGRWTDIGVRETGVQLLFLARHEVRARVAKMLSVATLEKHFLRTSVPAAIAQSAKKTGNVGGTMAP